MNMEILHQVYSQSRSSRSLENYQLKSGSLFFLALWVFLLMLFIVAEVGAQAGSPAPPAKQVTKQQGNPSTSNALPASTPTSDPLALEKLSNKVDTELKASQEHLAAMRDATETTKMIFLFFSAVSAVFGGVLAFFGIVSWFRQRHQDKNLESRLKESDQQRLEVHTHALEAAKSEEVRRSAIHDSTLELLREQLRVRVEEGKRLPSLLDLQHKNIEQINELTSAIAAGARENVETINKMFIAINSILEFKADEARNVKGGLDDIKAWREEREAEELEDLDALEEMAANLRASRHTYANPTAEFSARLDAYAVEFDRMGDRVLYRLTRAKAPTDKEAKHGEIFLRRGTIAYYANDIVRARTMLRTADRFYEAVNPEVLKADKNLARPCGFTKFYEALIEKNYGKMEIAKDFINASLEVWGKDNEREFLTPAVKAEILSGLYDIDSARECLSPMMAVVQRLKKQGQELPTHEAVYVARSILLLGDTYYIAEKWEDAERHYKEALEASQRAAKSEGKSQTGYYYAQHALAQVYERQQRDEEAAMARDLAHQSLLESSDLITKKALDTQILLNALGYFCTQKKDPEKAKEYRERAKRLLSTITAVDGLELRLFSLMQKKQISKDKFLEEILEN